MYAVQDLTDCGGSIVGSTVWFFVRRVRQRKASQASSWQTDNGWDVKNLSNQPYGTGMTITNE